MLFGSTTAQAAVIYTETFDNTSIATQLLSYDNDGNPVNGGGTWRARYGPTATFYGAGGVGSINPLLAISSGDSSTGAPLTGRLTVDGFNVADPLFVSDNSPMFLQSGAFLSVGNLTTSDFWTRIGSSKDAKLALRIGSQWYVTNTNYTSPNDATWVKQTVNIQTDTWRTLAVNPSVSFTIGATAQTLSAHGASGSLSSVGFYSANRSNAFWRVDTLTVNSVVPEPTSLATLGLMGVGLLRRRRSH